MDSYPTSLATATTPSHLLNRVPEEDGQTTPSHGGLVVGHEFDIPIAPRSTVRDPSPLRTEAMSNGVDPSPKESNMPADVSQTPLTPPVTPTPAATLRAPSAQAGRPRPASMPPQQSTPPVASTNGSHGRRDPSTDSQSQPRSRGRVLGSYTMSRTLGAGSMGKVKLAVHNETGEKVIILHMRAY